MKKVLIVATVDQHIRHFHLPLIKMLKQEEYQIDVAANGDELFEGVERKFNVPFERNPLKLGNLRALIYLRKILKNRDYDFIHVNTPMGSVLGRLAAFPYRKSGTKVIYTAHGFHFFKGASIVNWLVYFPVEFLLSFITDTIITMNTEDYLISKRCFSKKTDILKIDGVGVSKDKYNSVDRVRIRERLRKELKISENDCVLIYVAEISKRKNQVLLIDIMDKLKNYPEFKLLLVGKGPEYEAISQKIEDRGLGNSIKMLGYRQDVSELLKSADIAVSSSLQEGLPVNIIEAMFSLLPCIVSNCRGNRDLIIDGKNGFIIDYSSNVIDDFANRILFFKDKSKIEKFGKSNKQYNEKYELENILGKLSEVYK